MPKKKGRFSNKKVKPAFVDKRGEIYDLLEEPVNHIGLITFKKGAVRANHYHKKSIQYSYVLKGRIKLTISDVDGKNKKTHIIREGDVTTIPTHTVHTYEALTNATILDMTTLHRKGSGYEDDTFRVEKAL